MRRVRISTLARIAVLGWTFSVGTARAEFQLQYSIADPSAFTANQLSILNDALSRSKLMWETAITGYQPGINVTTVPITIYAVNTGLAAANFDGWTYQNGLYVSTSGFINVNRNEIENFANWQGVRPNGLNFVDELLAHETGHVLGIGTQWTNNGLYVNNTFRYTGTHGLAAYRAEFDPLATFVPVENAGSPGTPNSHWDQRMRSSAQEGNPSDPWSLDPRVGVADPFGRDRGLEMMSGAIDPDYREPFLSRTTVESMRDLGYTVAAFEDFNGDGMADGQDLAILTANLGRTGLQIDSIAFGDVDRDRDVDGDDLQQWMSAVPEPASAATSFALAATFAARRRRQPSSDWR